MELTLTKQKRSLNTLLEMMGLERRRGTARRVATAFSFTALGAALGAGAVLARALLLGREKQAASPENVHPLAPVKEEAAA